MAYNDPRLNKPYEWEPAGKLIQQAKRGAAPPAPKIAPPTVPVAGVGSSAPVRTMPPAPVFNRAPTSVPGVQRVTNYDNPVGAPLFTNIPGAAGTRGMFDLETPAQAADNAEVSATSPLFADQRAHEAALAKIRSQGGFRTELTDSERAANAEQASLREAAALTGARTAVGLSIKNSLARGISPEGLQAATKGLADLQPPVADAGDYASLLNAKTAQGRLGLGEQRLVQDKAIADANLNQKTTAASGTATAASDKAVTALATKMATDPLTGALDPTKFAAALAQATNLLGVAPVGGVEGNATAATGGAEAEANNLRAKGYPEVEIQAHIKKKYG